VHKCLTAYNNSRWRGRTLRVEVARPGYKARLALGWGAEGSLPHDLAPCSQAHLQTNADLTVPKDVERARDELVSAVSQAALAGAHAAADAAAKRRAKAAQRSPWPPRETVPLPLPLDVSRPMELPNPAHPGKPMRVRLDQPHRPPRRTFAVAQSLPLDKLEWQREEDFSAPCRRPGSGPGDVCSSSDSEGEVLQLSMVGLSQGGRLRDAQPVAAGRLRSSAAGSAAMGSRSGAASGHVSALYRLNAAWSAPMRPVRTARASGNLQQIAGDAGLRSVVGAGTAIAPPHSLAGDMGLGSSLHASVPGRSVAASLGGRRAQTVAGAVPSGDTGATADVSARVSAGGDGPVAEPKAETARREVRGELLSMFKVGPQHAGHGCVALDLNDGACRSFAPGCKVDMQRIICYGVSQLYGGHPFVRCSSPSTPRIARRQPQKRPPPRPVLGRQLLGGSGHRRAAALAHPKADAGVGGVDLLRIRGAEACSTPGVVLPAWLSSVRRGASSSLRWSSWPASQTPPMTSCRGLG
jgi:hypothetical protein